MDAPDKLKDLGLYPADDYESDEYFWLDSNGERVIYRGGGWNDGANAGVFSLLGGFSRRPCGHEPRLPCRLYPGNPVIWQSENLA